MLLAMMLLAAQDADAVAAAVAQYHELTRAEVRCRAAEDDAEIIVCARRDGDRYRLRYLAATPGDPRREAVYAERLRYIRTDTPCEARGPFLIGCGMVGVSMTVGQSGAVSVETERELAP